MSKQLVVNLGAQDTSEKLAQTDKRSYPIYIGEGLLANHKLEQYTKHNKVLIVTSKGIPDSYKNNLRQSLKSSNAFIYELEDGENSKNLDEFRKIIDFLLLNKFDRDSTIIALGGGVVGDLAGFVAGSYLRGINFIQVPTTLLAQVDSSVGGKVGVNHPLAKNMIGVFHQPKAVLIDISTLKSLPKNQLISGIAEVIKYGLIIDKDFFAWLEDNVDNLISLDKKALIYAIEKSCKTKADIVQQDEFEQNGTRALLNFGHTYGHAIEILTGLGSWLHGEAIAAGACMASYFSHLIGNIKFEDFTRIQNIYKKVGLPISPPSSISQDEFIKTMQLDKKVKDGKLRLVLLKAIGQAFVTDQYSQDNFQEVFKYYYSNTI